MATLLKLKAARGDDVAFQAIVDQRRRERMAIIDNLPDDMRPLVHEYGWLCVKTCLDLGIKKPRQIRHLVETVLNEFSPTRGSYSAQGTRADMGVCQMKGT